MYSSKPKNKENCWNELNKPIMIEINKLSLHYIIHNIVLIVK